MKFLIGFCTFTWLALASPRWVPAVLTWFGR